MTEFQKLIDWAYSTEVRAVGITKDGLLLAIKEAENTRGMSLVGLVVSIKHRVWFKENEEFLRETFSMNQGHGTIIIFGGEGSIAEVF
jgi:hypothetical protein